MIAHAMGKNLKLISSLKNQVHIIKYRLFVRTRVQRIPQIRPRCLSDLSENINHAPKDNSRDFNHRNSTTLSIKILLEFPLPRKG